MTELLRQLVLAHEGDISSMAAALTKAGDPITRQGVAQRLRSHGLITLASEERFRTGKQRPGAVPEATLVSERERIAAALERHARLEDAARALGVSRRTLCRRAELLGLVAS
jgi:transcriptional regulator with GAF, ATPase, and Fis domain